MTKVLCLDLGTKTGWASWDGKFIHSGVQNFAFNPRHEGGGMRFLKFQSWLTEIHGLLGIERLAYEQVQQRPASIAAGHVYGGFLGLLTAWCELQRIPYEGVPVGTIKKSLTGSGSAKKKDMVEWVNKKGHTVTDDNEADALAILYWLIDHEAPRPSGVRSALDSKPTRRVPVGDIRLPRRPVRR